MPNEIFKVFKTKKYGQVTPPTYHNYAPQNMKDRLLVSKVDDILGTSLPSTQSRLLLLWILVWHRQNSNSNYLYESERRCCFTHFPSHFDGSNADGSPHCLRRACNTKQNNQKSHLIQFVAIQNYTRVEVNSAPF